MDREWLAVYDYDLDTDGPVVGTAASFQARCNWLGRGRKSRDVCSN